MSWVDDVLNLNECNWELTFVVAEAVDQVGQSAACDPSVGHETNADIGFLAGLTVTENHVGTSDCPWVVRAAAGRRVNLTLFNFAGAMTTADELSWRSGVTPGCPVGTGLVVLDGNRTTAIPLCNDDGARQKRVYTSQGPVLRLFVQTFTDVARQARSKNSVSALQTGAPATSSFLIKYTGLHLHFKYISTVKILANTARLVTLPVWKSM